ncbi:glycosyltransferase family 4 protein [Streptomyces cinnabarinus]|uniref:Glycosyltransferase family 4 protein n=1 Tax=Streptomyces cinnabarinus TaxID=67287 RepID=A0ABY7KRR7_9ACTN|nr:glycosyltransferase family 4 protein [Streptomyces cinnabarinus]WAZ27269.1 glycosyltransferase family 4 protein [Streptomyces cinnabarinus]
MVHDYPPLSGGGLALAALDLAALLADRYEFRIVSARSRDHFADDRGRLRAASTWLCASPWRLLRWAPDADLVVVHWTFSFRWLSTLAAAVVPLTGCPTVLIIHTAPEHARHNRLRVLPDWVRRLLLGLAARLTRRHSCVAALSHAHALELRDAGIRPTHVLPLPVRPADGPGVHRARGPVGVVGFAGELSVLKGADLLPGLMAALTPRWRMRIAGAGPLSGAVLKAVDALPSARRQRVCLLGAVAPEHMPSFYRSVDFLLVVSRTESQCRVALEAMLAGVVVLAGRAGGLTDIVVDGKTGFLVDPARPAELRALLDRLSADRAVLDRVRRTARASALAAFEASRADWSRLLMELVPSGAGRENLPYRRLSHKRHQTLP